jgi:CRP-like cAMP-binding protein
MVAGLRNQILFSFKDILKLLQPTLHRKQTCYLWPDFLRESQDILSIINGGRKITAFPKKERIFVQGDSSDAVFYIREGKVSFSPALSSTSLSLHTRLICRVSYYR